MAKLTLSELRAQLALAQQAVVESENQINDRLRQTLVVCEKNSYGPGCDKASRIGELEFIQSRWYVRPYGCSEGDYWKEGEGQWECVHCGHLNRIFDPDIMALKYLFKSHIVKDDK